MRLWPWRRRAEPEHEEPAADEAPPEEAPPEVAPAEEAQPEEAPPEEPPTAAPRSGPVAPTRRPGQPASAFARPYAPQEEAAAPALPAEPPAAVSLTIDEAKAAIRAAGGDVIQIGFLARAYERQRQEEPGSREAAAARKRLSDLVAKRLEDRKLIAPEGRFELLDEPPQRH
jgi:hypothetical protein